LCVKQRKRNNNVTFETINISNDKSHQSLRIPKRLRINAKKVYLKKMGNTLFVIPFSDPWANLVEGASSFTSDFMEDREQPENQSRETID